jgi:Protein of unknown function (DUF2934)
MVIFDHFHYFGKNFLPGDAEFDGIPLVGWWCLIDGLKDDSSVNQFFIKEDRIMSRVATAPTPPMASQVKVPHEKIAMRAYEKWCKRGQPHGSHLQDWLEAEKELQAEHSKMPGMSRR